MEVLCENVKAYRTESGRAHINKGESSATRTRRHKKKEYEV